MIQCKRVYEQTEKSDGKRILVDRLWPRGIKKTDLQYDEWCRDIAPSADLRKAFHAGTIDFASFKKQYREELSHAREDIQRLAQLSEKHTLTLLYAAKDTEQNHARVLAEYLRNYAEQQADN